MNKFLRAVMQFMQFNLVGIMNTVVDFLVFTFLTGLVGLIYIPAKVISYSCGILNSYIVNTSWTFKNERKRTAREIILFVLVNLVSLGASLLVMYLCRNAFRIESDFICNIIATPVSLIINFIGNKLFVFRSGGKQRGES